MIVSECLEKEGGWEIRITKQHKETIGNGRYYDYLNCSDGFTGMSIHKTKNI